MENRNHFLYKQKAKVKSHESIFKKIYALTKMWRLRMLKQKRTDLNSDVPYNEILVKLLQPHT